MPRCLICLILLLSAPALASLWAVIPLDARIDEAELVVVGSLVETHLTPEARERREAATVWDLIGGERDFLQLGSLKVSKVLKGVVPLGFVRMAHGDRGVTRQMGDTGIWILKWDEEAQAYRCDYPWDPQNVEDVRAVESALKVEHQYIGPADGICFFASPRQSLIPAGEDFRIAVGLKNFGDRTEICEDAALTVWLDNRKVDMPLNVHPRFSTIEAGEVLRTDLGWQGELLLPPASFPKPGVYDLLVEFEYSGQSWSTEHYKIQKL